jgi:crotonobetainyl-CoA:carnitine CoA-transferase CaiB-like acyl-CoA transferase
MSGFMYVAGEPDRPPLAPSYPHGHLLGAVNGAVGTVIALCHRQITGQGQQVDASTHQSLCFAISIETKVPWAIQRFNPTRLGRRRTRIITKDGQTYLPLLWECKDGSVVYNQWFGPAWAEGNIAFVEWIKSDGIDPGILGRWDWNTQDWTHCTFKDTEEVCETLGKFFKKHTKMELIEGALQKRIMITPLLTPKEQLTFPQLVERDFWIDVAHPELGTKITYPGAFVKPGVKSCGIRFRAPLIGEHNDEIYKKELGMSTEELVALKQRRII